LASCAHVCRGTPEIEQKIRIRKAIAANLFPLIEFSWTACNAAFDPFSIERRLLTAAEVKKHRRDIALTLMIDFLSHSR
jgi:hypothetical protein